MRYFCLVATTSCHGGNQDNAPIWIFGDAVVVGHHNALAVFQGLVNTALRDVLNQFVFCICMTSLFSLKSREEHIAHVQTVLQHLNQHPLFVKAEKCQFPAESVSFMGFIIDKGSILTDPAKVSAVADSEAITMFSRYCQFLLEACNLKPDALSWLFRTPSSLCLWWPSLEKDTRKFVKTCPFFARKKVPRLLQPLPVLRSPEVTYLYGISYWSPPSVRLTSRWRISSANEPILCPCPDFHRQRRQRSSYYGTSSNFVVST